MSNYMLLIGGIVSIIGILGVIFFIGSSEFDEIGKICTAVFSAILIVGVVLSTMGIVNEMEKEKIKTDKKVENMSAKIIEIEKTNE